MSKTLHAQSSEIDIRPGKSSDVISVNMKLTATIFCMNTQKRSIEEQEMLNHLKKIRDEGNMSGNNDFIYGTDKLKAEKHEKEKETSEGSSKDDGSGETCEIIEDSNEGKYKSGVDISLNESKDMFQDSNENMEEINLLSESEDEDQTPKDKDQSPKENINYARYVYACDMCSFETSDENELNEHMYIPHDFQCSVCDYQTTQEEFLNIHKEKHKDFTFFCEHCAYQINSKEGLEKHLDEEHLCKICELAFPNKNALSMHKVISHESILNYECCKCDFIGSRKSVLDTHVKKVHGNEPALNCSTPYCETSEISEHKKPVHSDDQRNSTREVSGKVANEDETIHSGNEDSSLKYECRQCDHVVSRKSDLDMHVETVHVAKSKLFEKNDDLTNPNSTNHNLSTQEVSFEIEDASNDEDYEAESHEANQSSNSNNSIESLPEIENRYARNGIKRKEKTSNNARKKRKLAEFQKIDNGPRKRNLSISDDVFEEDHAKKKKQKDDEKEQTFVHFDIDKRIESFRLIQIENWKRRDLYKCLVILLSC